MVRQLCYVARILTTKGAPPHPPPKKELNLKLHLKTVHLLIEGYNVRIPEYLADRITDETVVDHNRHLLGIH
jgi:hypothetical protein